jgi:hypothetical protein
VASLAHLPGDFHAYPLIAPVIKAMREVRDFMDLPHFITEHLPSPVSSNERGSDGHAARGLDALRVDPAIVLR